MPMKNMNEMRHLSVYNASAGSGKTFTLAAYYVACLLSEPGRGGYRSILAVTFTKKATSEMKDRILTQLHAMAQGQADEAFASIVRSIMLEIGATPPDDATMRQRAGELFREMLAHYEDVAVMTIDSFLQLLMSGLTQAIGASAVNEIELDTKRITREAVDQILSTHIEEQKGLKKAITDNLKQKIDEEKSWDIRKELNGLAESLFDEAVQARSGDFLQPEKVRAFKRALNWTQSPEYEELKKRYEPLAGVSKEDFKPLSHPEWYFNFVQRMGKWITTGEIGDTYGLKPTAHDNLQQSDHRLRGPLLALEEQVEVAKRAYLTYGQTAQHLDNLALLGYIHYRIHENLKDANAALLAETASKLASALKEGDADFILEKAGIRYKHILLDEFQDTSTLQWQNMLKLVEEVLGGGGTSLIVGDTKQSIYRWRSGNRHLMEGLRPDHKSLGHHVQNKALRTNFRSRREVVKFNLETFARVPESFGEKAFYNEDFDLEHGSNLGDYYVQGKHEGGYVQMRAYPYVAEEEEEVQACLLDHMFEEIEWLLAQGVKPKDCLILIRLQADGKKVVKHLQTIHGDPRFARVCQAGIVSADSFTLDSSRSVNVVINGMKYVVRKDSAAREYVRLSSPETDLAALEQVATNLPLTEMMEAVITCCLCPNGRFEGGDVLYLNYLQDKARSYVGKYGSDAETFLQYWDDVMHEQTVGSADVQAIRLMTIHKSKGLEAKNVFIPFCNWPIERLKGSIWMTPTVPDAADSRLEWVPITLSNKLEETKYAHAFEKELQEQHVDNLNLLYVALTRAAERLYVLIPRKMDVKNGTPENVGGCLLADRGLLADLTAKAAEEMSAARYVEYTAGEKESDKWPKPEKNEAKKERMEEPFSFEKAASAPCGYFGSRGHILFRQSQESFSYTMSRSASASDALDRRAFGTICHDILAQVETRDDVSRVVDAFVRQGIIPDAAKRAEVEAAIGKAWANEQMCSWFDGSWQLMREETILLPDRLRRAMSRGVEEVTEQRPDRVMLKGDTAIVLDYKFGENDDDAYHTQVRGYMLLMKELGYTHVEGYLWMAESGELIKIEQA